MSDVVAPYSVVTLVLNIKARGNEMKNKRSKMNLSHWDRQILLQSMAVRCLDLFGRLETETMDLDVMNYFDEYYNELAKLVYRMEHNYPEIDMSSNNIDVLYHRMHMRKK